MKPVGVVLLLLFSLVSTCTLGETGDMIEQVCRRGADNKTSTGMDYNFCVGSLREAMHEKHLPPPTTVKDVAVISLTATLANGTAVEAFITEVLSNTTARGKLSCPACVEGCRDIYSLALPHCSGSLESLQRGELRDAYVDISMAVDTPFTCNEQFPDPKEHNELTKYNHDFHSHLVTACYVMYILVSP